MITITNTRTTTTRTILISGHASPPNSIVCAGVSALAGTLAEYVRRAAARGECAAAIRYQPGDTLIDVTALTSDRPAEVIEAVCAGFEMLAAEYSGEVHYAVEGCAV